MDPYLSQVTHRLHHKNKECRRQRRSVVWLVARQSARLVGMGVAIGLAGAFVGVRLLESLLYGMRPTDPETFAIVPAALAVVALVAAIIPAVRATRVDPIIAMRSE